MSGDTWMYGSTWGLRYWQGHFYVHLMWMHWQTGHWVSNRSMIRRKYKTLDGALKALRDDEYATNSVVMIFPV